MEVLSEAGCPGSDSGSGTGLSSSTNNPGALSPDYCPSGVRQRSLGNSHSPDRLSPNSSPGGQHRKHRQHSPGGSGGQHNQRKKLHHTGPSSRNRETDKEFVYAENFRPQRQTLDPDLDIDPEALILSSARPLVAPRGKIQRTPSKEVDPDAEPASEPKPTPVSVIGPDPPKFKIEIDTRSAGGPSRFYIENIESRATVTTAVATPTQVVPPNKVVVTPKVSIQPAHVPPVEVDSSVFVATAAAAGSPPPELVTKPTDNLVHWPQVINMPVEIEVEESAVDVQGTSIAFDRDHSALSQLLSSKPAPNNYAINTDLMIAQMLDTPNQKSWPFLALVCVGGFVSSATNLDPTYLILMTSLLSMIMFRLFNL